jgi:hypothetical protein
MFSLKSLVVTPPLLMQLIDLQLRVVWVARQEERHNLSHVVGCSMLHVSNTKGGFVMDSRMKRAFQYCANTPHRSSNRQLPIKVQQCALLD